MNNQTDNLTKYGQSFQTKVLSALLTDGKFLDSLSDIISADYFESDTNKWIAQEIINYHNDYGRCATLDYFKAQTDKIKDGTLKFGVIEKLRSVYSQVGVVDMDFIKDEFRSFCINQNLKSVILKSVDLLEAGNYDRIKVLVDNAMNVGVELDLGHDYLQDFDERAKDEDRAVVPTKWDVINDLMDGGLGPGELGVVVAPSGVGKTWILTALGAEAVRLGLNVVHYSMELSEHYVGARYDTVFTQIPSSDLKDKVDIVILTPA